MNHENREKLLAPGQVADLLGVTTHTLAVWRCTQRYNLPYIKCGRLVRYRPSDVEAFLQSRSVSNVPDSVTGAREAVR
ncbi:MAG TPA: helix-turn-helix domain-containing protein [Gammaproteobacteria bacterium]|nr:helix-turn-helix domain-containing protein [Gammaproteobacteria bacterium]